jgi:cytochrome c oxidase subunit II
MRKTTAFLVVLMFGLIAALALRGEAPEVKTIHIVAKRFAFEPNEIRLKKGETVKLHFVSEDVVHGMYVKPLKIDTDIQPGSGTEVTVTPTKAGKFTAICDHFCGAGHGSMKMTYIVEE